MNILKTLLISMILTGFVSSPVFSNEGDTFKDVGTNDSDSNAKAKNNGGHIKTTPAAQG